MKRNLLMAFIAFLSYQSIAQKVTSYTDEFSIEGLVEKSVVITLDSILSKPTKYIDSVGITNQSAARRSVIKDIKAVPLKQFLDNVTVKRDLPKQLSAYYLLLEANDGYKIVVSWNEMFNSKAGEQLYIIVEADGKGIKDMTDRITLLSLADINTGRRHMRGLKKITIRKAE